MRVYSPVLQPGFLPLAIGVSPLAWDRGGHVDFGAAPRRRAEAILGVEMEGISTNSDLQGAKCKGLTSLVTYTPSPKTRRRDNP